MDPDARDRLTSVVARINDRYGPAAIQRLGASATTDVQVIPTGLRAVDEAIGVGGLPRGRMIEILGPESSGVSTLLLHAAASTQDHGGLAALIDADLTFDPPYARRIGLDLSSLFIARPDDGAMALEIVDALVRSTAFDLVAIDAVPSLEPPPATDDGGASRGMRQGRLLSESLRRLAAGVDRSRTVLVFGNRVRSERGGVPEAAGGRALRFYASARIELRRGDPIRDGDFVVGTHVGLTAIKNKLAPPLRTGTLQLNFGRGFNKV